MAKAIWNNEVIAESDQTVLVEGNHYFPPDSVDQSKLQANSTTTVCGWKGTANYYDVVAGGEVNTGAAWYYADPKSEAAKIAGHVAFWKGVVIKEGSSGEAMDCGGSC